MRAGNTLYYLLGDHLGSTSVTVHSSGTATGRLRYHPYGAIRYRWGTTPTSYQFTGQRNDGALDEDFGLYYYNARYYDPALGRFIQADTVVPGAGNPQALNRYAYTLGNPLRYTDPSGHFPSKNYIYETGRAREPGQATRLVQFAGRWKLLSRAAVQQGVWAVARRLTSVVRTDHAQAMSRAARTGEDPAAFTSQLSSLWGLSEQKTFRAVYGKVTFRHVAAGTIDGWAWTRVAEMGEIWVDAVGSPAYQRYGHLNTAHELGHALAQRAGRQPYGDLNAAQISSLDTRGQTLIVAGGGWSNLGYQRTGLGYALTDDRTWPWQQHRAATPNEDFADMFLGWFYNHFANNPAGAARNRWMNTNMPRWIALAVAGD